MRVVQFNTELKGGGATNASYRLHQELERRGHDSRLIVGSNNDAGQHTHVDAVGRYPLSRKLAWRLMRPLGLNYLDIFDTFSLHKHKWLQGSDVALHFHNLHGGWFNYLALAELLAGRSAVWTLHDMWPFTGHCVYSFECERWLSGCGKCPSPDSYPSINRDNTRLEHWLKRQVFGACKLTIVTPSAWLAHSARQSFLGKFPVHHIPNGIDTDIYKPGDKAALREKLGLPQDKHILLFGCVHIADLWRKGGDMLPEIIAKLPENVRANCFVALFGENTSQLLDGIPVPGKSFGFLSGEQSKANLYSAADVLLFPSRSDNLPFVPMEAMACGVPSVGFDTGGISELVIDEKTGVLVKAFEIDSFAAGVARLVSDNGLYHHCAQESWALAQSRYSLRAMADSYTKLYEQCLGVLPPAAK
jgi:glycosyltransferase involved in cell wall biosynthesis